MAGPFLDRSRASRLMAAAGIDALVISEPEVFTYATGVSPGVPALFRRAGRQLPLTRRSSCEEATTLKFLAYASWFSSTSEMR